MTDLRTSLEFDVVLIPQPSRTQYQFLGALGGLKEAVYVGEAGAGYVSFDSAIMVLLTLRVFGAGGGRSTISCARCPRGGNKQCRWSLCKHCCRQAAVEAIRDARPRQTCSVRDHLAPRGDGLNLVVSIPPSTQSLGVSTASETSSLSAPSPRHGDLDASSVPAPTAVTSTGSLSQPAASLSRSLA